ncbi:hypothetical protein [Bacillus altitudinis]|uniref:hypothetical protein n=1 Tax=Bacillus altitudinis TaxID=293387 RepID=UPI0011A1F061|nr:hypothetical protein [Bacillus altitudinis]
MKEKGKKEKKKKEKEKRKVKVVLKEKRRGLIRRGVLVEIRVDVEIIRRRGVEQGKRDVVGVDHVLGIR